MKIIRSLALLFFFLCGYPVLFAADPPDLTITAVTFEEGTYQGGDAIRNVVVTVYNKPGDGVGPAPSGYSVTLHLSRSSAFDGPDDFRLVQNLSDGISSLPLGVGQTRAITWNQLLPYNLEGSFYVTAYVKPNNIADKDTSNNMYPNSTYYNTHGARIVLTSSPGFDVGLVSKTSGGRSGNGYSDTPSMSIDGRYVAFASSSTNFALVNGSKTTSYYDIFVADRVTNIIRRVSVASDGKEANGSSYRPSISSDGQTVVFHSDASNLVEGDTNNVKDVFIHDIRNQQTLRISVPDPDMLRLNEGNTQSNGDSANASVSISELGRYVVYESDASNLTCYGPWNDYTFGQASPSSDFGTNYSEDTNNSTDIFIYDIDTGRTRRINMYIPQSASDANDAVLNPVQQFYNPEGYRQAFNLNSPTRLNGGSYYPKISRDGRSITFRSEATNLVTNDTNNLSDVFVLDRAKGFNKRAVGASLTKADLDQRYDGTYGTSITRINVFVDQTTGVQTEASLNPHLSSRSFADRGSSYAPDLSSDGRYIVFSSEATNLAKRPPYFFYTFGAPWTQELEIFDYPQDTSDPTIVTINNGAGVATPYVFPSIKVTVNASGDRTIEYGELTDDQKKAGAKRISYPAAAGGVYNAASLARNLANAIGSYMSAYVDDYTRPGRVFVVVRTTYVGFIANTPGIILSNRNFIALGDIINSVSNLSSNDGLTINDGSTSKTFRVGAEISRGLTGKDTRDAIVRTINNAGLNVVASPQGDDYSIKIVHKTPGVTVPGFAVEVKKSWYVYDNIDYFFTTTTMRDSYFAMFPLQLRNGLKVGIGIAPADPDTIPSYDVYHYDSSNWIDTNTMVRYAYCAYAQGFNGSDEIDNDAANIYLVDRDYDGDGVYDQTGTAAQLDKAGRVAIDPLTGLPRSTPRARTKLQLISRSPVGEFPTNGTSPGAPDYYRPDSLTPSISADGRYVAFSTAGSNLTPPLLRRSDNIEVAPPILKFTDYNEGVDVYIHDRDPERWSDPAYYDDADITRSFFRNSVNTRASVDRFGFEVSPESGNPEGLPASRYAQISPDGRYLVYVSDSNFLAQGVTNQISLDGNNKSDVFFLDRRPVGAVEADPLLPDVTIVSPAVGSIYATSASVVIRASITTHFVNSTIESVEFFANGVSLGLADPAQSNPVTKSYGKSWIVPGKVGLQNIYVEVVEKLPKAIAETQPDGSTRNITSRKIVSAITQVTIRQAVGTPPVFTPDKVQIKPEPVAPATYTEIPQGQSVTLSVGVEDKGLGGRVERVIFLVNGTQVGEDTSAPFSITYKPDPTKIAEYEVYAIATDNDGNSSTTSEPAVLKVRQNADPAVELTAPTKNQTIKLGSSINLSAVVTDSDDDIVLVTFWAGDKWTKQIQAPRSGQTVSALWTPTEVGDYQIIVKAEDAVGNSATSPGAVVVTVDPTIDPKVTQTINDAFNRLYGRDAESSEVSQIVGILGDDLSTAGVIAQLLNSDYGTYISIPCTVIVSHLAVMDRYPNYSEYINGVSLRQDGMLWPEYIEYLLQQPAYTAVFGQLNPWPTGMGTLHEESYLAFVNNFTLRTYKNIYNQKPKRASEENALYQKFGGYIGDYNTVINSWINNMDDMYADLGNAVYKYLLEKDTRDYLFYQAQVAAVVLSLTQQEPTRAEVSANAAIVKAGRVQDVANYYALPNSQRPNSPSKPVIQSIVALDNETAVKMGGDITIVATLSQGTTVSFEWRKNSKNIPPNERIEKTVATRPDGSTVATLHISDAVPADAAKYSVKVTNTKGVVTSKTVKISILPNPPLLETPTVSLKLGQSVSFSVADGTSMSSTVAGLTYYTKGLPKGLKLDKKTGVVSGIVTAKSGRYSVQYWAKVGNSSSEKILQDIIVGPPLPPSLLGTNGMLEWTLGSGDQFYESVRNTTGGTAAAGLTYGASKQPKGLKINKKTGELIGTIKAKPGIYEMTYWSAVGSSKNIKTLRFVVNAFPVAGLYPSILLTDGMGTPAGSLTLTISDNGAYTGKLTYGATTKTYSLRGNFILNGDESIASVSGTSVRGNAALSLEVKIPSATKQAVVKLTDNSIMVVSSGTGGIGGYSRVPATYTNTQSVLGISLAPASKHYVTIEETNAPFYFFDETDMLVEGTATVSISKKNVLSFKGKGADGSKITASTTGSGDVGGIRTYLIYANPYKVSGGYFAGELNLTNGRFDGVFNDILWNKPAKPKDKLYSEGFGPLDMTIQE